MAKRAPSEQHPGNPCPRWKAVAGSRHHLPEHPLRQQQIQLHPLHYSTRLQPRANDLPVFEKLERKLTGEIKEFRFESRYAENRSKSFMHYWLHLVETSHQHSGKFREILASDFNLQMSENRSITQFATPYCWTGCRTSKPNRPTRMSTKRMRKRSMGVPGTTPHACGAQLCNCLGCDWRRRV